MDLQSEVERNVVAALAEDVGRADWTAMLTPETQTSRASVVCRQSAVLCGQPWFELCFRKLDAAATVTWHCKEGETLAAGATVCELSGKTRAMLTG